MKKTPSILKVKHEFLELYQHGVFSSGSKLPSETIMAQRFGVSRETWRGTLELLRRDGILVSRHGSGTYLLDTPAQISSDLSQLQSMNSMIASAGLEETNFTSELWHDTVPEPVYKFFQMPEDTAFCIIKRTRYTHDSTISVSQNYLPLQYMTDITERNLPSSLFLHLEKTHNIRIRRAFTEIIVPTPDDPLRQKLQLPDNVQVLGFKQAHYDAKGQPVLFSVDYLRCDYFHFTVTRIRD